MFMDFIKKRWPLFSVLIIFVFLKYPHLNSSFYWDESWPYASGVYKMYQNGPSLLPGAIEGELARGHPLLFHFMGAIWMKIFGSSIFSIHCYALSISVFFLILIYEVAFRLVNYWAAIFALVLVAFQQMYFVQSAFVLLEILLAFLVFVSIYFYVNKNYILTAISLTLLFYTKESGLVLGLVLGIDAITQLFKKEESVASKVKLILSLFIPLSMIGLFFLMQKWTSGWYVLPLYSNGFEQSWPGFYDKFRSSVKVVFRDDYRRYFFALFALIIFALAASQKNVRLLMATVISLVIFLVCSDQYHSLINSVLLVFLFFFSMLWLSVELNRSIFKQQNTLQKMLLISVVFSICFFAFTSYNLFFIDRYILCALIPLLFVSAVYFSQAILILEKRLFIPFLLVIASIQYYSIKNPQHLGDNSIWAFDGIFIHEQVVNFLDQNNFKDSKVGTGAYLEQIHLTDSNVRYLSSSKIFTSVKWELNEETEIAIFDNIEPDKRYNDVVNDSTFKLIFRVTKGKAWAEIYQRKNP